MKTQSQRPPMVFSDPTSISTVIRNRLLKASAPFSSNDNISEFVQEGELDLLQVELTARIQEVLDTLIIDTDNDHNSKETAARVAKMYLHETYVGRYSAQPKVTDFPNAGELDELYTVGPIHVNSSCSHHMVPIIGDLYVGVHPGKRVIGLSKFHRLAAWVWARGQIQEEGTIQLANLLEELVAPKGLAVVFKAKHFCCACRGVKDGGTVMTTSVVRGTLRDVPGLKSEFFDLIRSN